MNNEYDNQEFNSINPDQREEPSNINFTMRDSKTDRTGEPGNELYKQNRGCQEVSQQRAYSPYDDQQASSYYQEAQYHTNQGGNSYIPPQPEKKPEKKRKMAVKIAGVTAAALLFGVVSGGTIVGINWAADSYKSATKITVGQAETTGITDAGEENPVGGNSVTSVSYPVGMDVSGIVEKAMPSVVAITNTMLYQSNSWFGPTQTYKVPSSGSGIIIGQNDSELLIVTNNHVVQDSSELKVTFIDNASIDAAIKGTDSDTDLAIIAVPLKDITADTLSKISIAQLGDSDSLKVGQGVIAIGNALGYGQSVTVGYVSAVDREVQTEENTTRDLLQTDAAINPGNSGGALLNMKGEVIGINAAKYSSTEVEGMGYAIPISKVQDIIGELMSKKTRIQVEEGNQGYLGIQGQSVDEASAQAFGMPRGIFIYKIVEGGAASKSSLREKDIITKFDGQSVNSMEELKNMLTYYEGGTTITLTVQSLENGQYVERNVELTLEKRPVEQTN